MTMAGGATGGYCEIGSWVIETAPITMMNSAITQAKIGRSMKNLAMDACLASYCLGAAAGAAAEAAGAGAWPAGCQGTALTGVPGGSICSFWKPSTMTCSPA